MSLCLREHSAPLKAFWSAPFESPTKLICWLDKALMWPQSPLSEFRTDFIMLRHSFEPGGASGSLAISVPKFLQKLFKVWAEFFLLDAHNAFDVQRFHLKCSSTVACTLAYTLTTCKLQAAHKHAGALARSMCNAPTWRLSSMKRLAGPKHKHKPDKLWFSTGNKLCSNIDWEPH